MKKKLNIESITNELEGASLFFTKQQPHKSPRLLPEANVTVREAPHEQQETDSRNETVSVPPLTERHPSKQTSINASTLASYHASVIETIRKAVKHTGREVTFVRLTPE
jgi:hypothetical protein